jgi:hypothetical protein
VGTHDLSLRTILFCDFMRKRRSSNQLDVAWSFEAFMTTIHRRDRLRLYDNVKVCQACAEFYGAETSHAMVKHATADSSEPSVTSPLDLEPSGTPSGHRAAHCHASTPQSHHSPERKSSVSSETTPFCPEVLATSSDEAIVETPAIEASVAFSDQFDKVLRRFQATGDLGFDDEVAAVTRDVSQTSHFTPGLMTISARTEVVDDHRLSTCAGPEAPCKKGCGVLLPGALLVLHELECQGHRRIYTVEVDCRAICVDDRYKAFILDSVRSLLTTNHRVRLKQQLSLEPNRSLLTPDEAISCLRSLYWEVRSLCENVGMVPRVQWESLQATSGETCYLDLVPVIHSGAVKR